VRISDKIEIFLLVIIMDNKKIVIESLLTGSQFEVGINENDKILKIKSHIQKTLGKLDG
jgi:hypothetical protein